MTRIFLKRGEGYSAENGEYCKHIAAVLYREYCRDVPAIYSKIQSVKKPKGSQKSKTEKSIDTFSVLQADIETLKDEIKKNHSAL